MFDQVRANVPVRPEADGVPGGMVHPKIQLLVFDGCPLADAARRSLRTALDSLGVNGFEEIDLLGPATPYELQGWGSPTILVDGLELTGSVKGNAVCCRMYEGENGVPSPEMIAEQIRRVISSEESRPKNRNCSDD